MAETLLVPPDYISGLDLSWGSVSSISVSSGAAFLPNGSAVMVVGSPITVSGLTGLTASTWYYAYLYSNGGVAAVEVVTTAPATPYRGAARAKTADTSRRFVGSLRTNASAQIMRFTRYGADRVRWLEGHHFNSSTPTVLRIGYGLGTTTTTNFSTQGLVPPHSTLLHAAIYASSSQIFMIGNADLGTTMTETATNSATIVGSDGPIYIYEWIPLDASQQFNLRYLVTPTTGIVVNALGYQESL